MEHFLIYYLKIYFIYPVIGLHKEYELSKSLLLYNKNVLKNERMNFRKVLDLNIFLNFRINLNS